MNTFLYEDIARAQLRERVAAARVDRRVRQLLRARRLADEAAPVIHAAAVRRARTVESSA
jgi:hypothetical protein